MRSKLLPSGVSHYAEVTLQPLHRLHNSHQNLTVQMTEPFNGFGADGRRAVVILVSYPRTSFCLFVEELPGFQKAGPSIGRLNRELIGPSNPPLDPSTLNIDPSPSRHLTGP